MVATWPTTLAALVDGHSLTREQARESLTEIMDGAVDEVIAASFLTALTAKGETVDEMIGFVNAMMEAAETFSVPAETIDIVGTGGDRLHSVNLSTMAALTVAGCGVPVAKHGNRAASSTVGTADVLESLGVKLDVDGPTVARCVKEAGIGFCFAQRFHPGLRFLGPIRRSLGFPTVFNVLGPLANPADRDHCIQYMVAIPLLFGRLNASDYEDLVANDPRVDALRSKMQVKENTTFTQEYYDASKRFIGNAIKIPISLRPASLLYIRITAFVELILKGHDGTSHADVARLNDFMP